MRAIIGMVIVLFASTLSAAMKTETVKYAMDDKEFQGFLAYDDAVQDKRPGVLIIPEWWGMTDYPKERARQLAKLGYVAFVADMYGGGVSTQDPKEAGKWASEVRKDMKVMQARAAAGLEQLRKNDHVDPKKIAAIGYCFGGTTVLELAMSGADLAGVVSFHGGLDLPNLDDAKNIKCSVRIENGAADEFVKPEQIQKLSDALSNANVDWVFTNYSGAHHAFTNPDADKAAMKNVAYNEKADKRSWREMLDAFGEWFGPRAEPAVAPGAGRGID